MYYQLKDEFRLRGWEPVHWAITSNCNCRYRHCYMSGAEAGV